MCGRCAAGVWGWLLAERFSRGSARQKSGAGQPAPAKHSRCGGEGLPWPAARALCAASHSLLSLGPWDPCRWRAAQGTGHQDLPRTRCCMQALTRFGKHHRPSGPRNGSLGRVLGDCRRRACFRFWRGEERGFGTAWRVGFLRALPGGDDQKNEGGGRVPSHGS